MKSRFALLAVLVSVAPVLASESEVPVVVGEISGFDACTSLGQVTGLRDRKLVLRSGPGSSFRGKRTLQNGDLVHLCSTSANGKWSGVVLAMDGVLNCGVSSPLPTPRPYKGPCTFGWIPTKWTVVVAG